jgi:inorganic pyrophosphatase
MKSITVVVETPKGSAQKYNFNPEKRWFELKKIMPAGMVFPFDFGFIPDTKGEDGDPLDIIAISELKSFPGCVMECRIIGAIQAEQTEDNKTVRNDRFLAIPEVSQLFAKIKSVEDLPKDIVEQIESFFINYNKLSNKKFKPLKTIDASKAFKMIKYI